MSRCARATRARHAWLRVSEVTENDSPQVGVLVIVCWNDEGAIRARVTYTNAVERTGGDTAVAASTEGVVELVRRWMERLEAAV